MIKHTTVFGKCGVFYHGDSGDFLFQNLLKGLEE